MPGALHPYSWRAAENARADGQKHQEKEWPYSGSKHTWSQTRISVTSLRFLQWGCNVKVLHTPGSWVWGPRFVLPSWASGFLPWARPQALSKKKGSSTPSCLHHPCQNATWLKWSGLRKMPKIGIFLLFFCSALDLFSDPVFSTNPQSCYKATEEGCKTREQKRLQG